MNEIKIKVDFEKRAIQKQAISLTSGDYNSTKIKFEFDKEYTERKVFELANEEGTAVFVSDIPSSNELVLVGYVDVKDDNDYIKYTDTSDNIYWYDVENQQLYDSEYNESQVDINTLAKVQTEASIFETEGNYPFEVSLYGTNSKLTSATGFLQIRQESVRINDEVVSQYIPVFDNLMNQAVGLLNLLNRGSSILSIDKTDTSGLIDTYTITYTNGTTSTFIVKNGEKGDTGDQGIQGIQGPKPIRGVDYFTLGDKSEMEEAVSSGAVGQFNQNATEKTETFNSNAITKTEEYNANHTTKMQEYNDNDIAKVTSFDENAVNKTNDFNLNSESKTTEFNNNKTQKTDDFNTNAVAKKTTFDTNAETKTADFNTNATNKTTAFDNNATNKTTEFNNNVTSKTNDFDSNASTKITNFNTNYAEKKAEIDEVATTVEAERKVSDKKYAKALEGTITETKSIQLTDSEDGYLKDLEIFGESNQEVRSGKNKALLINSTNYFGVYPLATTFLNNEVTFDCSAGTGAGVTSIEINTSSLDTSSFSAYVKGQLGTERIAMRLYESDGTTLIAGGGIIINLTSTYTRYYINNIDLSSYDSVIINFARVSTEGSVSIKEIQLENGSMSNYEQYGATPSPEFESPICNKTGDINVNVCGKNSFRWGNYRKIETIGGYPRPVNNGITINSLDNNNVNFSTSSTYRGIESDFLKVFADENITITLTIKDINRVFVTQYDNNKNRISTLYLYTETTGNVNLNITTIMDGYITIAMASSVILNNMLATYIQLERGSTATTYEPYQGQNKVLHLGDIRLCKLPNVTRDRIYENNGKWWKEIKVGNIVLNGTETILNATELINYVRMSIDIENSNIPTISSSNSQMNNLFSTVSTAFNMEATKYYTFHNTLNNKTQILPTLSKVFLNRYAGSTYSEKFSVFLAENNWVINYELATPVTTEITDTDLIEALEKIKTFYGTTNITSDITLKAKYNKDLNIVLNNLQAQILALGGE